MPNIAQTNLIRGEIDPKLLGRVDIRAYSQGLLQAKNISLEPQGPGRRRPGTVYFYDLAEAVAQMIEFIFGEGQEYLFVLTNNRVKFFDALDLDYIAEIAGTVWTTSMLKELYWAQSADTTVITHPSMLPQIILRTGVGSFSVAGIVWDTNSAGTITYAPMFKHAADDITITPSATAIGAATATLSRPYWVPAHVGLGIRIGGKYCTITGYTSSTVVAINIVETLAALTATTDWEEFAFSSIHGYPLTVTFHDQRLIFFGSRDVPDGFWASKVGAPYNFDKGTAQDGEAIQKTIGSEKLNSARGIISGRHLQLFTDSGPFYVPQNEQKPIAPGNVAFRKQAGFPCAKIKPRELDGASLFVQNDANVMRELLWQDTEQAYTADSVSILSGHLINDPTDLITVFGGQDQPDTFSLLLNGDGTLAQFQSIRSQEVSGWTPWSIDGAVLAIASVNSGVFWHTQRTINGITRYSLEKLVWDENWTLDFALFGSNPTPIANWSGATYLAGQRCHAISQGQYLGEVDVALDGSFVLEESVTEVLIGIDFPVLIESLPPDAEFADGPLTGEFRHIVSVVLRLRNTLGLTCNGQRLLVRRVDDDLSEPPIPVDGQVEFFLTGWSRQPTMFIEQPEPLPMTVCSWVMRVES